MEGIPKSMRSTAFKTYVVGFVLLAMLAFCLPQTAHANMAANTQIINSARVDYNDGAAAQHHESTVTVTVALVPAAPTIAVGSNQTGAYTGANTQLANTFTITSNANGPDTYDLSTANTGVTNAGSVGAPHVDTPGASTILGATVTLAGSSDTDIYVAPDGTSNSSVNGIVADDWVVIGSDLSQVDSVTDNASGTSHIILKTALAGGAPAAGVLVAEQQTVTVHVLSGTITTPGTSIVASNHLTAASNTTPAETATSADMTDTYTNGLITFTKYVRNVTGPIVGGGGTVTYATNDYYRTGVTAKPGEVLEYLLVITNSGSGQVSAAYITDGLPVGYVDFRTTPYSGSTAVTYVNAASAVSYLTATADTDAATWASPTLTVYVGTGATSSAGGTIAAAATVRVLYQVSVK
jgi:hypothetical protein